MVAVEAQVDEKMWAFLLSHKFQLIALSCKSQNKGMGFFIALRQFPHKSCKEEGLPRSSKSCSN